MGKFNFKIPDINKIFKNIEEMMLKKTGSICVVHRRFIVCVSAW